MSFEIFCSFIYFQQIIQNDDQNVFIKYEKMINMFKNVLFFLSLQLFLTSRLELPHINDGTCIPYTLTKCNIFYYQNGDSVEVFSNRASFWSQTCTLTSRSFKNMSRDMGYYWLRLFIYIVVSLCIGTIYYRVGTTYNSIMVHQGCPLFNVNS